MNDVMSQIARILGLDHPVSPVPQNQNLSYGDNYVKAKAEQTSLNWLSDMVHKAQAQKPQEAVLGAQTKQPAAKQYNQSPTPTPTPFGNSQDGYVMDTPSQYRALIGNAAKKYNVPSSLLSSLLYHESHWDPHARSPVGAEGIAQFMPGTAKELGINPFNPDQAIPAAAKYLRGKYDEFGQNSDLALASYNAGSGAVHQYGGIPPYKETQDYVRNIQHDANFTFSGQ